MKKIITTNLLLLFASMGFSQNAPINFETGGQGANWTWTTFENASNPTLEIVNNPSAVAPNTSSKVAKFTALPGGKPWAGCESIKGAGGIGTFTLTPSNAIVKMMVYKSKISDVGIKFVKNDNSAIPEIKVANTKINEWEELTFDFTSKIGTPEASDITQIVVFLDFVSGTADRTDTTVSYFDNITFSAGNTLPVPTAGPTAPTKPAADVISLFSNAYTNVNVDTWRTSWSAATLTDIKLGSDDVKRYTSLDFVGIETVTNQINISAMNAFEFDVWTPNSTTLKFKLVDFGPNGAFGGGDDKEHEISITPVLNSWNHITVPISDFTGLTTKSNIAQLIFASVPSGTSVIYIDNVMFTKATVLAEPTVAAPTPSKPAVDVISMFSNAYTNVAVDTWRTSWSAATLTDMKIGTDDIKKYSALDFVGIETVANQINITNMDSFEFDVWTPNSTTLRFKLVDFGADGAFGGGDDKEHETTLTPVLNGWNHVSTSIASMTGLTSKANIAQLIFASAPTGTSIIYVDNIIFSRKPATGLASVEKEAVGIYPNPATNLLNITTAKNIENIVVYNALGQVVLTAAPMNNTANLNIANLENGFYTVKITVNGADTFKKIIKE